MKQVKIAELKDHLSEHLRAVEHGAEIEVTDRRRPIVRMVPAVAKFGKPVLRSAVRSFREIRARRYPRAHWAISSAELLAEERGER